MQCGAACGQGVGAIPTMGQLANLHQSAANCVVCRRTAKTNRNVINARTPRPQTTNQARSQKFAMGALFWGSGGQSPQPPEANGSLGRRPQLPEARGCGVEPPALENFAFFCKNNLILELFFCKNNLILAPRPPWLRYCYKYITQIC